MKRMLCLSAILCLLVITAACGKAALPESQTHRAAQVEDRQPPQTAEPTSESLPPETMLRTLPGMIMSDVHVCRIDEDVSPGLRAEDAKTVKTILAAQTFGDGFDNISDVVIDTMQARFYYETQAGILTNEHGDAAKLSHAQRDRLNAILTDYLALADAAQ